MLKRVLNAVISLLLPWSTLNLYAQSDLPRFETAGQFALMSTGYRNAGVGGRFSYNASEYLSFDSEVDYFPQDKYAEGKKTLGLFGVKIGPRTENAGFFTIIRPGFVKFSNEYTGGAACDPLNPTSACFGSQTHFAFDIGGGFEYFPTRHTVFRFDIGNLIIRLPGQTTNNLLMNVGFGIRF